MTLSNKICTFVFLTLTATSAWSEPVNFCKTKKIYDSDINAPAEIAYEDCSGVAFLWYAKDLVKASCWKGATDLVEGKCNTHKDEFQGTSAETPKTGTQEEENQTKQPPANSGGFE